ncbi:MAG: sigma-70 family RNA polymerase sigma factor [Bryobacterales bacterium]|nr:sigma-70 family RNA polymerase sigma factor [Bryobacterales bacterium]
MHSVTRLLIQWKEGDESSRNELFHAVRGELRRIAARYMRRERAGHVLQPSALVNEAYLRLVEQPGEGWQNRAHFFAISAHLMRQILVDYARRAGAGKRGGEEIHIPFDEAMAFTPAKAAELLALHQALEKLAEVDSRKAQVVELRYFGGLEVEEVAAVLEVHPNTVVRDWQLAKAWLKRALSAISDQAPVPGG